MGFGSWIWFQWNSDTLKYNLHFIQSIYNCNERSESEWVSFFKERTSDLFVESNPQYTGYALIAYGGLAEDPNKTYNIPNTAISFHNAKGDKIGGVIDPNFSLTIGDSTEYDFLLETPFLSI